MRPCPLSGNADPARGLARARERRNNGRIMARLSFTRHLQQQAGDGVVQVPGATVAEALGAYFGAHDRLRGYVLDDQGCVRKHVTIFVDGQPIRDRDALSDPITPDSEIYVMQALSGG